MAYQLTGLACAGFSPQLVTLGVKKISVILVAFADFCESLQDERK